MKKSKKLGLLLISPGVIVLTVMFVKLIIKVFTSYNYIEVLGYIGVSLFGYIGVSLLIVMAMSGLGLLVDD